MRHSRMPGDRILSYFASSERASDTALKTLAQEALRDPIIRVLLDAVQGYLLILNRHRQVLAGNEGLLQALGVHEMDKVVGLRPGELLHCTYAQEAPGGCGTSRHCSKCGAVLAILASQKSGQPAEGECSLSMLEDGRLQSREFYVRCTPLELAGQSVTAMVLQDITAAKHREVLERLFLHDLKNVLHALVGYSQLLALGDTEHASRMIIALSNLISEEIDGQTFLLMGEHGELTPNVTFVLASDVLNAVQVVFREHTVSQNRRLETQFLAEPCMFETDSRLLTRVLVNMVKNAFEAVPEGSTVRMWFEIRDGAPTYAVWNAGAIPDDVALQIFRRSFSTKGQRGRGLGTFGMKLLGEQYLKGRVSFSTSEAKGTEFSIRLPAESLIKAHNAS